MKKLLTIALSLLLALNLSACGSNQAKAPEESEVSLAIATPGDESSNAQTESKVQEESKAPEQKLSASDFLKAILQKDAATSEVSARQQLWKEGYSPAEIKEAIDNAFPKSQTEVKKEESSVVEESSKQDESSKTAENSEKQESSKVTENENSEESRQQASGGSESTQSSSESQTGTGSQSQSGGAQTSQGSSSGGSTASSGGQSTSESQSQSSSQSASESQSQSSSQASSEQSQQSSSSASESQSQQQTQEQSSQSSQTEQPAHTHTWVDVTETVHHDAVTEQVWVVDQPAWDETVEKTEEQEVQKYECRCGQVFDTEAEWGAHSDWYVDNDFDNMDYHTGWTAVYVTETVVTGTEIIHHDEVGHYETKTVTEAYDEEVVVGQKCSECGATK